MARKEWRRLEPLLRGARILTDADRAALVAACRQWSRYVAAERQLTEGGLLVPAGPRSKHKIPSPYLSIANKTLELCVKLWTELGLTPSARTRVEVARTPPAQATLDTFLKSS